MEYYLEGIKAFNAKFEVYGKLSTHWVKATLAIVNYVIFTMPRLSDVWRETVKGCMPQLHHPHYPFHAEFQLVCFHVLQ